MATGATRSTRYTPATDRAATIWLADHQTFNEMNGVWDAWVPEGNAPARACVESALAFPPYTVEIGVIATV